MKKYVIVVLAALIVCSFCCGLVCAQVETPGPTEKIPPETTPLGKPIPARDVIPTWVVETIGEGKGPR